MVTLLHRFLNTKLPPGFPVKFEVPVLPTVTATVTFESVALVTEPIDVPALLAGLHNCTHEFVAGRFFDNLGVVEK